MPRLVCSCVHQALLVELLELKAHHAKAAESRTLIGHLRNALGYAMSGYCVYRVLASFKALLVGEDFSSDPVSRCVCVAGDAKCVLIMCNAVTTAAAAGDLTCQQLAGRLPDMPAVSIHN